jgi:hypothetical protein
MDVGYNNNNNNNMEFRGCNVKYGTKEAELKKM